MDLLRQILIRLPTDAFNRLPLDIVYELSKEHVRLNTKLPETEIDVYRGLFPDVAFGRIEAYQGQMSLAATAFIMLDLLTARAAFLADKEWYLIYARMSSPWDIDVNPALISGVPEIQAQALALAVNLLDIPDPELIRWTHGLIRYYREYMLESVEIYSPGQNFLAGYLHIELRRYNYTHEYLTGYIRREMLSHPDPFRPIESLDRFIAGHHSIDRIAVSVRGGYFPPTVLADTITAFTYALRYVQPKLLGRLPRLEVAEDTSMYRLMPVTQDLAERAREMVALVRERYPGLISYRTKMKILGGLHVDMDAVDSDGIAIMFQVAHPQIKPEWTDRMTHRTIPRSTVYYDLIGFFRKSATVTAVRKLTELYTSGKLLKAFTPERIVLLDKLISPDVTRTPRNEPDPRKYLEILAMLTR